MNKSKRLEILTRLRDNNPHPTTELNFHSPFELLIAVLLSAQATDVSVNKATAKLYPVANRVCNRTQFAPGKNVEQVEEKLLKVVPAEFKVDCHHWLILHGRYTCIARKPRCGSCLIEDLCEYKEKVDL